MSADKYLQLVLHTQKQETQTFDKRKKIIPHMYGVLSVGNSRDYQPRKKTFKFSFKVHAEGCVNLN